jgi:hypothetical protein
MRLHELRGPMNVISQKTYFCTYFVMSCRMWRVIQHDRASWNSRVFRYKQIIIFYDGRKRRTSWRWFLLLPSDLHLYCASDFNFFTCNFMNCVVPWISSLKTPIFALTLASTIASVFLLCMWRVIQHDRASWNSRVFRYRKIIIFYDGRKRRTSWRCFPKNSFRRC